MEAKVVRSTGVEPAHKQQHSYDSGAYIEWPGEDAVREDVEPKFASNVTGEFVTVVAVEPAEPQPSPYVTVLAIGDNPTTDVPPVEDDAEDVLVYRLPGERLGFALKFEGGLKTVENVGKLYIQSCAPDSPASRTKASWGPLGAGDEVLEIDGQKVCEMTRIDCVRLLKESNVVIKLRIRPLHKDVVAVQIPSNDSSPPPPPIPPRKTPRRNSTAKEKPAIVCPPDGFADLDSSNLEQNGSNKQDDNLPEAEVYMDLLAKEAEIPLGESESDDTGSSISTVVDRLSSNSSFSDVRSITSLDITAPSTPTVTTATTFDLDRVLEPFLQLEREFSSSATSVENSLFTKLVALTESQSHVSVSRKSSASVNDDEALQPPESFKDCPENAVAVNGDENKEDEDCGIVMKPNPRTVHNVNLSVDEESEAPALPPKPTPRKDLKSKFKSGKKRPPPPPPPRSDRPLCPDPESPVKEVFEESDHLPRLIDFVPKDRTDVVVPSAIHPDPNQLDLLIQQRRLIDLINSKPESDASCSEAEVDSWYPCDVLDTIGEVDEEQQLPSLITETVADDDVAEQVAAEQENICLEDSTPQLRTTEEEEQVVDETTGDDKIEDDKGIHAADDIMSRVPETIEKVQTIKAEDPENKQKDTSVEGDNLQAADEVDEEDSRLSKEEQEEEVAEEVAVKQKDEEEEEEEEEGRAEEENTGAPAVASAVALNCEQGRKKFVLKQHSLSNNGLPVLPAEQITDIPACLVAANDAQGTNNTGKLGDDKYDVALPLVGARTAMDTLLSDITALNLSPPPSFSRLPPDGHEFPPDYQEPHYQDTKYQEQLPQTGTDLLPAKTGRLVAEPTLTKTPATPPPLPCTAPPVMRKPVRTSQQQDFSAAEKVLSSVEDGSGKCGTRPPSWRNDEKSEKSVRDKIAMFSNVTDEAPVYPTGTGQTVRSNRTLNRFKSSEDVFLSNGSDNPSNNLPAGKLLSRSVMSVDKVVSSPYLPESSSEDNRLMKKGTLTYNSSVDILPLERRIKTNSQSVLEFANRTCSTTDLTSSSSSTSSAYSSSCSPETSLSPTMSPYVGYSSTLPRKNQTERKASLASTRSPSLDGKSHSTGLSRAVSFTVGSKLHTRSQSLVDVGSGLNKYVPNTLAKSNTEEARRASLNALIEQRRRSISKLRGLVIPEKVNEVPSVRQTILDLPEIISKDAVLPAKKNTEVESRLQSINSYRIGTNSVKPPTSTQTAPNLLSPPWKSETDTGVDLPKYSPAFKRKSLAVYGISSSASSVSSSLSSSREELRPYFDNNSSTNYSKISKPNKGVSRNGFMSNDTEVLQSNEPPKSLESITSPTRSDMSFEFVSSSPSSPDDKMMTNGGSPQNGSIKSGDFMNNHEPEVTPVIKMSNGKRQQLAVDARRSGGEESDNDSAVSSSRSSISHDFSPPPSPLPDHVLLSPSNSASSGDQRTLRRTLSSETTASAASSTASTLTSGSQASCSSSNSDSMNRRVLKAQSVEAINRKNVLSSARFSSGQDLKVGSPLIQRKFENENILDDVEIDNQANNDHQHTKNFIEKLNETLLKEDASETGAEQNEDGEELITYQIAQSNVNFELNPKKVAYLEVEVVDGTNIATESEQILSDSSSSNPSSMDGLSYGYSSDSKIMYNGSENECDNNLNNNVFYSSYEERNGFGTDCEKDDESCRRVKKRTCDLVAKDVKNEKSSDLILSKKRQKDGVSRQKETEVRSTKQKELVNGGKVQPSSSRVTSSRRSVSVNDIRKAFEKADLTVNKTVKSAVNCGTGHSHARVSSLDSTASEDSSCVQTPTHFGSITNLQKEQQFGSITSLASSTSLISQQELQQLIDDANQTLEENGRGSNGGVSNHEVVVVILHRDMPASSVGITLAGGADYESKEITVHKVLAGSPADRDGRIQKGDRILSINGKSMKGVTHRESLTILKAPRPEVVLVVSRWRPDGQLETPQEDPLVVSLRNNQRHPRIPEQPLDVTTALLIEKENVSRGPPVTVCLQKDGAGLGFSLEGGKDSPLGDMPLTIKKIFTGGCAEKSGQLFAGDELLLVNGTDVTTMSRIEAWSLMKRLADGKVTLSLRHKTVTA